jgi:hypothetical protein
MRPWIRITLIAELIAGVFPVTALYLYLFPAGLFWVRRVVASILEGTPNTFTIGIALVFPLGGVGLVSVWWAVVRRLRGRDGPGRLLIAGLVAGMLASIILLGVVTVLGAFWLDYYLYGTPVVVAAHHIVLQARSGRRFAGAAPAAS